MILADEILFPDEPVDVGTPWKHHYIWPARIIWNSLAGNIYLIRKEDIDKMDFGFTGFDSIIPSQKCTTKQ